MTIFQRLNEKIPRRGILGVMLFLAPMFSYFLRTNLSIIIVAMIKSRNETIVQPDHGERFDWGGHEQGALLAAYFIGVIPSSIPSGRLAERYGGAKIVAWATLIPALLNLLMPIAAHLSLYLAIVLRFLMGLFGAPIYPACHAMIARWVPPNEKGMFVWCMTGGPFGAFVTLTLCGLLIPACGWACAFYVTSGLILIFWLLWLYLIYDTPDVHPTITEAEKTYIKEQIGSTISKQKTKLPMKAVMTSVPFLTLLWLHFANMWGIYLVSVSGAKYTLEVLGLNMKSGGFLTGLPYIVRLFSGAMFAATGDYIRRKKILGLGLMRKGFTFISHALPGFCLLGVTYAGLDQTTAMVMLILNLAFNGAACQTNLQNHQDLSPNFAGSLYGIMNTLGSFPGFIIPPIVGAFTHHRNGVEEWRPVFWISAGIFFSSTVLFWIFGSAKVQKWNESLVGQAVPDEERQMTNIPANKNVEEISADEADENVRL